MTQKEHHMNPIQRPMRLATAISILAATISTPLIAAAPGNTATPAAPAATNAMQKMQAMHEKMMAAKTPAERQALMGDQMKAMQEGMKSMQAMNSQSGDTATSSMPMRMNMMTMMMQMMMDQQQMGGMSMGKMGGMSTGTAPSTPPAGSPAK
jgi:hypothetical protein